MTASTINSDIDYLNQKTSTSMSNIMDTTFIKMDDKSFLQLSNFITKEYGIKLPAQKKSMIECRLNKKLKALGMSSYKEFLDYIFSDAGIMDMVDVIDLITTNKTDFYRESHHFKFLTNEFLPHCIRSKQSNLRIWSAGCSTGEEPYTLVFTMEEFKKRNPDFHYQILASDISVRVIQKAFHGIYPMNLLSDVPADIKRNYFLQSKANGRIARVKPEYRKKINYRRINLIANDTSDQKEFDVIFCRNVLIYFDKPTQEKVIRKFCSRLRPGGLLFLGHSESVMGMNLPLKQVGVTTYQLQ